jgi:hypothetical protein
LTEISGTIPLPPNGLSRKLKSEYGKINREVGYGSSFSKQQIQQRRASEEKPISVNSDFVSAKQDTNPPPSPPHFFPLLFSRNFFLSFVM